MPSSLTLDISALSALLPGSEFACATAGAACAAAVQGCGCGGGGGGGVTDFSTPFGRVRRPVTRTLSLCFSHASSSFEVLKNVAERKRNLECSTQSYLAVSRIVTIEHSGV